MIHFEKPEQDLEILSFGNRTKTDKAMLRRFVDFHWSHYAGDPRYVPLLDYEYLGQKLFGIKGFFEAENLFFKHADMVWFLALRNGTPVGRSNAFVNHHHNRHWNDRVGFFGQFECVNDPSVARAIVGAAAGWLKGKGMDRMRGPQNLPVNEATPGVMTQGFDSRPVMYYHYNKPYYAELLANAGFLPIKRVLSWEVPIMNPMEEKLARVGQKVVERFGVTFETWGERPLKQRKMEMFDIYNDAWNDNFGFVPFTREEFDRIVDDMLMIMDKSLFLFLYVKGEAAAFFGGVPNVTEFLKPIPGCMRCEMLRALKMLLNKGRVKGFRVGYLGVKRKFRRMGLDGVMLWKQKNYSQKRGYTYSDMGWVLEDNVMTVRLVELIGARPSKTYTIFEKAV